MLFDTIFFETTKTPIALKRLRHKKCQNKEQKFSKKYVAETNRRSSQNRKIKHQNQANTKKTTLSKMIKTNQD